MKYEVEIKSLLQSEENAQKLRDKLNEQGIQLANKYSQLNHYFLSNGDFKKLKKNCCRFFLKKKKRN